MDALVVHPTETRASVSSVLFRVLRSRTFSYWYRPVISPTFEISGKSIETPVPFGNPDSPAFQSHHVFVVPMGSSIFLTPPSKKNKQTNKTNSGHHWQISVESGLFSCGSLSQDSPICSPGWRVFSNKVFNRKIGRRVKFRPATRPTAE